MIQSSCWTQPLTKLTVLSSRGYATSDIAAKYTRSQVEMEVE